MTSLDLTFLGTSAAMPTAGRNVSGLMVKRGGDRLLVDCGEGTQRQMIHFGTGFGIQAVLFTHFHADHYLGIVGLTRTLAMQGRQEPLVLIGPKPAARLLPLALGLNVERLALPVEVREIESGVAWQGDGYRVEAFATDHRISSVGYVLVEDARPGRFDVARARALGVRAGPDFGKLVAGGAVCLPGGRVVDAAEVVGPPRPGRRVVISGDTRPAEATIAAARGADLLVHEATFGDEERERAAATGHATAREAASVAHASGARRLVLTHLSARYAERSSQLLDQAAEVHECTEIANDGTRLSLPQRDGQGEH